jgi:hypothetical protein
VRRYSMMKSTLCIGKIDGVAFPARLGALKARYGAAEDHLAAQIARIVKTQRSAAHMVSA